MVGGASLCGALELDGSVAEGWGGWRRVCVFRSGFFVPFWGMFGAFVRHRWPRLSGQEAGGSVDVSLPNLRSAPPAFQVLGSVFRSPEFLAAMRAGEDGRRGVRVFQLVVIQVAGSRI